MEPNQALEFERVAAAVRDSLTDEMVGRLGATASESLDLLDQINRSGVGKALPAFAQLVQNGDLERLVALARTYGAAQDALTDEMITRMAGTVSDSLSLMDRLNRAGIDRLVGMLERLGTGGTLERLDKLADQLASAMGLLERMVAAIDAANREMSALPASSGGLSSLWRLVRSGENQEALRFLLAVARALRTPGRLPVGE